MRAVAISFGALLGLLLFFPPALAGEPGPDRQRIDGRVTSVADGDSVRVRPERGESIKVRISAIDAPEKGQAFGDASRQNLERLLLGKRVSVLPLYQDQYRRTVAKVITADGRDAGLEQLSSGLAWHYKRHAKEQTAGDRSSYQAAEKAARLGKRGLWSQTAPISPSGHRSGEKGRRPQRRP